MFSDTALPFLYDPHFLAWVDDLKRALGIAVPGEATRRVFAQVWAVRKLLPGSRIFLLEGETGTGKEAVARAIAHLFRPQGPLVSANLGGIPPLLLESELFGHVRGAFTGAEREKEGLLLTAQGGTFFGDEINTLALDLQPKLLRLLGSRGEEVRFFPVGSESEKRSDCLFVFASGEILEEAVEQGRFREDLFYRVQSVRIHMPPLRERGEEILAFFKAHISAHTAEPIENIFIDSAASNALLEHAWPGNLRELFAKAEQALLAVGYRAGQGPVFVERRHLGALGRGGGSAAAPAPGGERRRPVRKALLHVLRSTAPDPVRRSAESRLYSRLEARLSRRSGLSAGETAVITREHGLEISSRQARAWLLRLQGRLSGTPQALETEGRTRATRYAVRVAGDLARGARRRYQGVWEAVVDWRLDWGRQLLFYGQNGDAATDLKEVQTRGRVYFHELKHPVPAVEIVGIWHVQAVVNGQQIVFSDLVTDFSEVERDSAGGVRRMRCNIRFKKERPLGDFDGIRFSYNPAMRYDVVFSESSPERMTGQLYYTEPGALMEECGRVVFEICDRF